MYQIDSPRPLKEVLPTMYNLKSEDLEKSVVTDEFHDFQSQLLRETFYPPSYPAEQIFVASNLKLYYDPRNHLCYKRPDWFAVLGVSKSSQQQDLRLSYVVWLETIRPLLVVELLSPGTEAEDLGQKLRDVNTSPSKWEVYERILRVPYYVVFDRYTNNFRAFILVATRYQELSLPEQKLWLEDVGLGLGLWQGFYQETQGLWLRCYDADGNWIPTADERAQQERQQRELAEQQVFQERQRAEFESHRAERLAARLRELNIDPDQL